jgi:hypothetical protein
MTSQYSEHYRPSSIGISQMTSSDAAAVVQRQLDAYNTKNMAPWLATHSPNAEQFSLHGQRFAHGHEQIREYMQPRFAETDLQARLPNHTVMGPVVVDLERITRNFPEGKGASEMICVYEVVDGLIVKASFGGCAGMGPVSAASVGDTLRTVASVCFGETVFASGILHSKRVRALGGWVIENARICRTGCEAAATQRFDGTWRHT